MRTRSEFVSEIDVLRVEQDGEDGLRGARVGDHLLGEEDVVLVPRRDRPVVGLREALLPLEEEDEPMHLAERLHRVRVEGVDLFELHSLDAHRLN